MYFPQNDVKLVSCVIMSWGHFTGYKKTCFFVARELVHFSSKTVTLYNVTIWAPGVTLDEVTLYVALNVFRTSDIDKHHHARTLYHENSVLSTSPLP